jgi:putative hemolysin
MDLVVVQLALVGLLVLINAYFAGAEIALVSLDGAQLQRLEEQPGRGQIVTSLVREPNRYLATVQVAITLAGFLASATAAVTLAEPLEPLFEVFGAAAEGVAIVTVTLALAFVMLVLGELAPKRLAMQQAERWALATARPLAWLGLAARPVVWLLSVVTDLVVRVFGGEPEQGRRELSPNDLRALIEAQRSVTPMQRRIVAGAFEARERTLHDILLPRGEVISIRSESTAGEARAVLAESGHHRAPVHRGELDDLVGIAHLVDLTPLPDGEAVAEHLRPAFVLPETANVLDALRRAQRERQKMVLVTNEHGGIDGLVTVEDLVEELVGEIFDQYDPDELTAERTDEGALILDGSYPIHDLADVGVELPDGPYATLSGLVMDRLGRIARRGDEVDVDRWRLRVLDVRRNAVIRVRLEETDAE